MKKIILLAALMAIALMSACAEMDSHPMDMNQTVKNAETKADHEALAKHYDEAADAMQVKVDEHKKLLGQYESKAYLYGRQTQSFKDHCQWLLNAYEKAVDENRKMAELHRAMVQ
jgi:endonuclease III